MGFKRAHLPGALWQNYQERFIEGSGRVVDDANGEISHSEGQGYAMLLAVNRRDRETFDRVWQWARDHLRNREDHLFIWKWEEGAFNPTPDSNNATDGDILIAWALLKASQLWEEPAYLEEALKTIHDIRRLLVRESPIGPVLLPGMAGFEHEDYLILNPSYWIFPALIDFHKVDPTDTWMAVFEAGIRLIREGGMGEWGLSADWVGLGKEHPGTFFIPEGKDPLYGYDAVRVPLNLVWAGLAETDLLTPFDAFVRQFGGINRIPATLNLETGRPGDDLAMRGGRAIHELLQPQGRDRPLSSLNPRHEFEESTAYFSASLTLLAEIARQQSIHYQNQKRKIHADASNQSRPSVFR